MLSEKSANTTSLARQNAGINKQVPSWLLLSLIFVFSLSLTLVYQLGFSHPKVTLIYDSVHYLAVSGIISDFLLKAAHGQWHPEILLNKNFCQDILLDGPVLPTYYGVLFALLGRIPAHTDWRIVVVAQSVFQAMSTCLIAAIVMNATRKTWAAIVAACLWGLYPAAVVASGRLMTEIPTATCVLLFVWALQRTWRRPLYVVPAGVAAGLIVMLKPALIPAVGLTAIASTCLQRQSRYRQFVLLVAVIAITILPWASYTKTMTGKMSISAERMAVWHLTSGCDTEADGWGSCNLPPLTNLLVDFQCRPAPIIAQWTAHPSECLTLTVRKVTRLLSSPWNDFRFDFFGVSAAQQRYFHLWLLLLGLTALACIMLRSAVETAVKQTTILCTAMALGQFLAYLIVDPTTRYAFTLMPMMAVGSGLAGYLAVQLLKGPRPSAKLLLAACALALLTVAAIVFADDLTRSYESKEIAHELKPGSWVNKYIDLSTVKTPELQGDALLFVDGDKGLGKALVKVNDHQLSGNLLSIHNFKDYPWLYAMREQAVAMGLTVEDLRQWRVISFPSSWLNARGANRITVLAKDIPATIYGDSNADFRQMSSWDYVFDKMNVSTTSLDARTITPFLTGRVKQTSWYGIAMPGNGSRRNKLPDSLRVKLAILNQASAPALSKTGLPGVPVFAKQIDKTNFHQLLWDGTDGIRINKQILRWAPSTECRINVPELRASSHLKVRLQGDICTVSGPGKAGIPLVLIGKKGQYLILGGTPAYVQSGRSWSHFVIEELLPVTTLWDGLKAVCFNLYPCPWQEAHYGADKTFSDVQLKHLKVEIQAVDLPDLTQRQAFFY